VAWEVNGDEEENVCVFAADGDVIIGCAIEPEVPGADSEKVDDVPVGIALPLSI
jgi:hypothetical protein